MDKSATLRELAERLLGRQYGRASGDEERARRSRPAAHTAGPPKARP